MSKIKHGLSKRTPDGGRESIAEWRIYHAMKTRCLNEKSPRFKDYGGRGIKICDRWLNGEGDKTGVELFIADLGPRPSNRHSLDRIDNSQGYSPENCRWASVSEQTRNTRANRVVTINGEDMPLVDAVARFSTVSYGTVQMRLFRGWPELLAITAPLGTKPTALARPE